MAPLRAPVSRQHEQKLRKLATDEEARQKARVAFTEVASEAASLDVLERCKRLNEFLSQDYAQMGKAQSRGQLQQILEMLSAKNTNRPACLDKPSVLSSPSKQPCTNPSKAKRASSGRSLADSAACPPKITNTMAETEAMQLLTLLEDAEHAQSSSSHMALTDSHGSCSSASCSSLSSGDASDRPSSGSSTQTSTSTPSPACSTADADDDLILLFNPSSTAVPRPNNSSQGPAIKEPAVVQGGVLAGLQGTGNGVAAVGQPQGLKAAARPAVVQATAPAPTSAAAAPAAPAAPVPSSTVAAATAVATVTAASSAAAVSATDAAARARAVGASKVRELQQRMLAAQAKGGSTPAEPLVLKLSGSLTSPKANPTPSATATSTSFPVQAAQEPMKAAAGQIQQQASDEQQALQGEVAQPPVEATLQAKQDAERRVQEQLAQRVAEEAARRAARMAAVGDAAAAKAATQHAEELAALTLKRKQDVAVLAAKKQQEEAAAVALRRQQEREAELALKKRQEEEAVLQKQREEQELKRQQEAADLALRKKQEEEAALVLKKQQEEAAALTVKRQQEEEARLQRQRQAAAICIQRHWQGWHSRCDFCELRRQCTAAAVCLQAAARTHQALGRLSLLRALHRLRRKQAARLIQQAWRTWHSTRGWQLGELRVPGGRAARRASDGCAANVGAAELKQKRTSDGDLLARPLRVRCNADARLAPEDCTRESPGSRNVALAARRPPLPASPPMVGGVAGKDAVTAAGQPASRRAVSATRERSGAVAAEEGAKRRELGERVVMTSSAHRTSAQAIAVATQRAPAQRHRQLAKQTSNP